jgi:hypothetical protein
MSGEALEFVYFPLASVGRDANELTAITVGANVGNTDVSNWLWTLHDAYSAKRFKIQITTTINYATPTALEVVRLYRRVAFGSDTGRVELARLTVPDGALAGDCFYVDIPTDAAGNIGDCMAGDQLLINVLTQGTGGGGLAGAYRCIVEGGPRTESNANMLNSASHQTMTLDTTTVQASGVAETI